MVSVKVSCAKARGSYLDERHVSPFDSTSKMLQYWISIWPTSCQNTHNIRSSAENFFNKNKFHVLFSVVVAIVALYIRLTRYKRMLKWNHIKFTRPKTVTLLNSVKPTICGCIKYFCRNFLLPILLS